MYASNSHSYTHLILALGIVREPTVWVFITSKYPGTHDIGLPGIRSNVGISLLRCVHYWTCTPQRQCQGVSWVDYYTCEPPAKSACAQRGCDGLLAPQALRWLI